MNLLIDIGNTRLKWATANNLDLMPRNPIANTAVTRNALSLLWQAIQQPNQLAISSVGASQLYDVVISVANQLWPGITIIRAQSETQGFGLTNAYQEPEKLGVDRWLSMIAGYQLYPKALCIADCGTAITVDVIDNSGQHLGGMISPGLRLMKEALANSTENLQLSETAFPFGLAKNTDAAIHNGTLSAACGLIDSVLKTQPDTAQLLLTGGDAKAIAAHMGISKNSKSSFSLREKVDMRGLKSSIYNPHPSPLPEGEGIFRDSRISKPAIIDPDLVLRGLALMLRKPS
ncbi:MAG: type III pantothenate kinase [Proteobacteria bacterium]|nr:type III pantothenate kinase [Pseudomonadota bacterium]